ncbi:hypothetical protein ACJRO7_022593 [Eucalyptus globulus]|uniref:Peroxidase n=1 Tax=Eucalyptus globulus TaxID=34317 RepID=A0ABD3K3W4_EUCGL
MASFFSSMIITFSFFFVAVFAVASAQLSPDFYASSCPSARSIIQDAVSTVVSSEPRMGASLLRLHFHDCFVNGCDASVLLDDTEGFTGEKTAGANVNSIRGFDAVDNIKTRLEEQCPGIVSCADILAVAAHDSVAALGGPTWTVQLGRRDSTTASLKDANSDVPSGIADLSDLISLFSKKGFSAKEMVALSGVHTIGQARCFVFRIRIYNEKNIDPAYAASLRQNCPSAGGDANLVPLEDGDVDGKVFNNDYFKNLVSMKGLLHTDQQLFNNGSTDADVKAYSLDSASFFADLANALVKMGNLSPLTGTDGQVRTNCRKVNGS